MAISYSELPESWQPEEETVDEQDIIRRLEYRHLKSIGLCRVNRDKTPHALRTEILDQRRVAVKSLTKATCDKHVVWLDEFGFPQRCELCPGFQARRYCSHCGAALERILGDKLGISRRDRIVREALTFQQQLLSLATQRRQRDNNVVHSFTPKRGDWLRPE